MQKEDMVFHHSENGDDWRLVNDVSGVVVEHRPNPASGGKGRTSQTSEFLESEQKTPQGQALQRLIETHVGVPPRPGEPAILRRLREQLTL